MTGPAPAPKPRLRQRRQAGVTLVELVVSIVIIAIAVTGVLLVMNTTSSHGADPMIEHQAVAIADSYLEEILSKSFLDPSTGTVCPPPEPSRSLYDNVCDYNGLVDNGARDQYGNPIPGLQNYTVSVTVTLDGNLGPAGQQVPSADALRVNVRVTNPAGVDITVSGYRTHY